MHGVMIAGTHSGCGKTTATLGILAALRRKGLEVQSFKAGPDFIDSGLHRLITGRHSRNLDIWMCGQDEVVATFRTHSADAGISVVEGAMGLYDGRFSTASLARLLGLPVILVIDAYGMAESAGAVARGFAEYGKQYTENSPLPPFDKGKVGGFIAGIIFNRVASESHFERLKKSVRGIPVLGYLPRDPGFEIPHRHLGLVVAEESPLAAENIDRLADAVLKHMDVDAIVGATLCGRPALGSHTGSPPHEINPPSPGGGLKIAVAMDKAFCFYYEDNLDTLRAAGAEIIRFSPLAGHGIPEDADAVYIGGGYPELHAEELSGNLPMLASVHEWAESGRPLYAECGGLMYLSKGIHDFDGRFFKMAEVFPFETQMKRGKAHLGYREVFLNRDCILGPKGALCRGHEFHYSEIKGSNELQITSNELKDKNRANSSLSLCYSLRDSSGHSLPDEGYCVKKTLASYIHLHFGSNSGIGEHFIKFIKES
ncbi:MAG TPA: cobyrinate a,c-diamide synthase [Dissulfurispiraceae bacterium]